MLLECCKILYCRCIVIGKNFNKLRSITTLKDLLLIDRLNIVLSLQVFQVPLEQCSQLTDCQSCTASPNPLCGWCTVEQKCSRQSQCQNSSEMMRWVEDDTQCITTAFSPAQFVLGIGQNVSMLLRYCVSDLTFVCRV